VIRAFEEEDDSELDDACLRIFTDSVISALSSLADVSKTWSPLEEDDDDDETDSLADAGCPRSSGSTGRAGSLGEDVTMGVVTGRASVRDSVRGVDAPSRLKTPDEKEPSVSLFARE